MCQMAWMCRIIKVSLLSLASLRKSLKIPNLLFLLPVMYKTTWVDRVGKRTVFPYNVMVRVLFWQAQELLYLTWSRGFYLESPVLCRRAIYPGMKLRTLWWSCSTSHRNKGRVAFTSLLHSVFSCIFKAELGGERHPVLSLQKTSVSQTLSCPNSHVQNPSWNQAEAAFEIHFSGPGWVFCGRTIGCDGIGAVCNFLQETHESVSWLRIPFWNSFQGPRPSPPGLSLACPSA